MSEKNNQPTIQEKVAQLNELVAWFDGEEFQLEEAFERFRVAEKLAETIEHDLDTMKNEINVLKKRFDTE